MGYIKTLTKKITQISQLRPTKNIKDNYNNMDYSLLFLFPGDD
jgi:hypothetical protein